MKILSIDPSVNNVGWATFDTSIRGVREQWKWGKWELEGSNRTMRLVDLVQRISEDIGPVDQIVTEYPTFFSSEKGQMAARQNYTIDLAAICGYIAGRLCMDHHTWHCLTATQWKGTVKKEITARKFFRFFSMQDTGNISEHSIDAIMMLHYWIKSADGERAFNREGMDCPQSPIFRF